MKRTYAIILAILAFAFVACTSDMDQPERGGPRGYPGGRGGGGFARARAEGAGDGLEMMPPSEWWRDPQISVAVNLTADQTASLDRINHDQSEEIAKLERDSMVAMRDLRQMIESSQPTAADITGAGQRLRGVRDALFDRRVQLLAGERTILTQQQWDALQTALTASRNRDTDRPGRGGYGGRGGRGGMGGRGRFPG
jgi:Spy/CpxP family protein refolding chaperone